MAVRSWWPTRRRSCSAGLIWWIWDRDGCGTCQSPVGVFQIRAPGLRTEFPPLRGVDSNPGNLRPAITSLIGRDAEVANLQAALRSHRLVTLAGVGGVGKTRLAVEVATQLAPEFVDGVWFFELAAVADPAAIPDAVAAVLGITQQPGKSVGESVASALEGRSRLLVFDNCEHVVDSVADLVAAILAASATVKVLATSREGTDGITTAFQRSLRRSGRRPQGARMRGGNPPSRPPSRPFRDTLVTF